MFDPNVQVRQNLKDIEPYKPGLSDEQLRKELGNRPLVKLNSNENTLGPSPLALRAMERELPRLHLYPDGGSDLVKVAVAKHHHVQPEQVFVGNGSDDIIKLLSETFLDEGDEIVTPFPTFSQYTFGAQVMKATVKLAPLRADFTYDVEALLAAVTERTKLLYLCTPNNPTGTVLKQVEFDHLMEHLPDHVLVIVDMAYDNYATDPERFQFNTGVLRHSNVCLLYTFSKLYGLAGLRVGYAIGHPEVFAYVHRVREPFNVNRIAQVGAVAALSDAEHVKRSQELVQASRRQYETLRESGMHVVPSEANFALIEVGDGKRVFEALRKQAILVRTGFVGLESYVRVSFGTEAENEACIAALREVVAHA
ncbi:histidinol-phosphate aminotransferase [Alicyclobacillus hesperidum]|uniref:Histidinol-phosphate aminotransferase n=1 Tax=Alicyclobacillus hesperidum TaxID=89784 RepID=A0A1H2TDF0_9BACL|nr:histidinol-phosphate transaminase [Alicyclobacillus hesperidum]GLV13838.1 histidinol-phosphate aminotransferase [Alicyclobacillus hesperidum]SDW41284.1 histidinol-phosphate aminotransferase [Alicyclobacillus hesperidum]